MVNVRRILLGFNILLIVPEMTAAERFMINSKPSQETSVTYSDSCPDILSGALRRAWLNSKFQFDVREKSKVGNARSRADVPKYEDPAS